jgi:hypothetical protein
MGFQGLKSKGSWSKNTNDNPMQYLNKPRIETQRLSGADPLFGMCHAGTRMSERGKGDDSPEDADQRADHGFDGEYDFWMIWYEEGPLYVLRLITSDPSSPPTKSTIHIQFHLQAISHPTFHCTLDTYNVARDVTTGAPTPKGTVAGKYSNVAEGDRLGLVPGGAGIKRRAPKAGPKEQLFVWTVWVEDTEEARRGMVDDEGGRAEIVAGR